MKFGKRPEYIDRFDILVDPENPWVPPKKGAEPDQLNTQSYFLGAFSSQDQQAFSDLAVVAGTKGSTRVRSGLIGREKLIRGVIKIEGVEDDQDRPISHFTEDNLRRWPGWITRRILRRLNELNEEEEEEEGN